MLMLYALNQESRFASKSVLLRWEDRPRFITSVGNLTDSDIGTNLESFFFRSKGRVAAEGDGPAAPQIKQTLLHMMIDDVNMEARRRPAKCVYYYTQ